MFLFPTKINLQPFKLGGCHAEVWEPLSERQLLRLPQRSCLVVTIPVDSMKEFGKVWTINHP